MGKWLNGAREVRAAMEEKDITIVCTRDIDPLLYPPSQVAAHFTKEQLKE